MTYIVAVKYGENCALIADTRVTFGEDAEDTWLKTGLFFHGCMFGYCGCVESAREFIRRARRQLAGRYHSVREIWDAFVEYANTYDFPSAEPFSFELLLSTRAFGSPRLFVLDSRTRLLRMMMENIVTLGRGQDILDDFVKLNFGHRAALGDDQKPEVLPWMWCLQLMERAQGDEKSYLNRLGVGGYFHYSFQTATAESRQPPALYVICEPDKEKAQIICRAFRIFFCGPALVVECPNSNQRFVIFDYASWPRVLDLNDEQLKQLQQRIDFEANSDPFYNFCGFGCAVPALRGRNPAQITTEARYLLDRSGAQRPEFSKMVHMLFASDSDVEKDLCELKMLPARDA